MLHFYIVTALLLLAYACLNLLFINRNLSKINDNGCAMWLSYAKRQQAVVDQIKAVQAAKNGIAGKTDVG